MKIQTYNNPAIQHERSSKGKMSRKPAPIATASTSQYPASFGAFFNRGQSEPPKMDYDYLYRQALEHGDPQSTLKVFPQLMSWTHEKMDALMTALENRMDNYVAQHHGKPLGLNENEAEYMAACFDHPKNGYPYSRLC